MSFNSTKFGLWTIAEILWPIGRHHTASDILTWNCIICTGVTNSVLWVSLMNKWACQVSLKSVMRSENVLIWHGNTQQKVLRKDLQYTKKVAASCMVCNYLFFVAPHVDLTSADSLYQRKQHYKCILAPKTEWEKCVAFQNISLVVGYSVGL